MSTSRIAGYELIRTRRVTRNMSTQPVDQAELDLVLRAARYAPNAGNRRLQPVTAVTDGVLLRLLRMISPGMIVRPQAAAVICIDVERAVNFGFRADAPGLYIDVGTTAATLLLAAHAAGLASCPVTSFSRIAAGRILQLGPGVIPTVIICLGHAAATQPATMSTLG
jgi:nitroreductase